MTDGHSIEETATGVDLSLAESELDERRAHITSFIEGQVDEAGLEGAVLGLSGGIDSTTTAYLAVDALGADAVHGLVMPGEVNTPANMSDAERVAETLEMPYDVLPIEPIYEAAVDAFPAGEADRNAAGNVRVRLRGVLNYFVANAEDRLVLGTGNRSEALVGYFTKYGDGAVDCHPIGNLYKCQVRQLARSMGVPDDLVEKTPSAEMWAGQTDEAELGVDYGTLDHVLALHIDGPFSRHATAQTLGLDESVIDRVVALNRQSEHKRHMPPSPDPLPE